MNSIDSPLLGLSQRLPPSNLQAEQALLGALLANNKAYERVSEFLAPEHFADPIHGRIFQSIARRIEAGQLADAVTLKAEFEHSGVLEEVGGTAYLAQLLTSMIGIINAGDYGHTVHDAWLRRQLIDVGETLVNRAFGADAELDGRQQMEAAEQQLFDLATRGGAEGGFISFDKALILAIESAERAFQRSGSVSGLSTGLRDLDAKTGGLHPSDLLILAGRPGMGKSGLATKIAFGAARAMQAEARKTGGPNALAKETVAIFSLEMSSEQLASRLLAEEARISGDRIRRGDIGPKDFDRFVAVSRDISSLPLEIDDTPAITLSALRTRCRRLKRSKGLGLVVIDYLQLMRPAAGTRPESRVLEISMISQLSRAVESREDKRPQLSDLRESGSIEQDADAVMFIYRDEYYLAQRAPKQMGFESEDKFQNALEKWQQDMERVHNKAELYLAKQRHGPTGKIDLFFEAEFIRFADLDQDHDDHR
jgi:replicative DNA helicase